MEKILFVGEHPYGPGGNCHMMDAVLRQVDFSKYDVTVFAGNRAGTLFSSPPYKLIEGGMEQNDYLGSRTLIQFLSSYETDVVFFVGLDIWAYTPIYNALIELKKEKKFTWVSLFPYDLTHWREDWKPWFKPVDFPLVYSKYGLKMLNNHVEGIRYYRPPLLDANLFKPQSAEKKQQLREKFFPMLNPNTFLFGFLGNNQFRKDPQRAIRAFFNVKEHIPNIALYFHTHEMNRQDSYNLNRFIKDCGGGPGDVFNRGRAEAYNTNIMVDVYASLDCVLNTSLQEGLSWTLLETQLCSLPIIAADNTAQHELLVPGPLSIPCTDLAFVPVITDLGRSWVETRACNIKTLETAMKLVIQSKKVRETSAYEGRERALKWLEGVDNVNTLLEEVTASRKKLASPVGKIHKVLFVQHSSAGDVLMSTQCFKGITERHPGMPLVYMTQTFFQDIVKENPLIDEIIDFDEYQIEKYEIVYNPHGDRILPGGFNNLDARLYEMYPYFCKVEAVPPTITLVEPAPDIKKDLMNLGDYIVVHTTGGDPKYRTYAHMDTVVKMMNCPTVQIGGKMDRVVRNSTLDLRGKLTFRQTAWVTKHSKGAVVIDSFPAHLAGALHIPVVVLFGPAPARVTRPRGDDNLIWCLEPNKLDVCAPLTNCWGQSMKKKCESPCINTISPLKVVTALKELLERNKS